MSPSSGSGSGSGSGSTGASSSAPKKFPDFVPPTKIAYTGDGAAKLHLRSCRIVALDEDGQPREHKFQQGEIRVGAMDDNDLVVRDGVVAGTVTEPILGREAKREALVSLCRELELDLSESLAVGDGANDIDMIGTAGLGIAFRAKPALKAVAPVAIDHGDLTALLYLQGYRQSDFTAA